MVKGLKGVILAGGLGTRLRPYTLFVPKPMLPLGDKPLLEHTIDWLRQNGVRDVVISVSYLRRLIEDYFDDGKELGVSITYVRSTKPLGTAGQLKVCEPLLDGSFVCAYGDSIYGFDLEPMIQLHRGKKTIATMAVKEYRERLKYGFIDVDSSGKITKWREKPEFKGLVNAGIYLFEPAFLKYIPPNKMYGMDVAFTEALKAGERIFSFLADGKDIIDIGDKKSYNEAYEKYLSRLGKIL
jgi:mannose-1-phosphate guanylyltransferase